MKYIKTYEVYDMKFLKEYRKFMLLDTGGKEDRNFYVIVENLGNQMKKIYEIKNYELTKYQLDFYFTWGGEKFNENFIYDTNDLDEILSNYKSIIKESEFYRTAKQYNL